MEGERFKPTHSSLQVLQEVYDKRRDLIEKGTNQKLGTQEVASVLVPMIFEITRQTGNKYVQVRDYAEIEEFGPFRYAGQTETMHKEGLMPDDVYEGLKKLGRDTHVGPSYLRVKSLLTWLRAREFFGKQMALTIQDYLISNPLEKEDGLVVVIPNMTGGAWIGDETIRNLEKIGVKYPVWPVTPYAREMRFNLSKVIDDAKKETYGERVEGIIPKPYETGAVICFEELRTAAETTQNATNVHRDLGGYNQDNKVRVIEAAVFDYRHPVGVERLKRLGVDALYLVDGQSFFETSYAQGYITIKQLATALDWLTDPWAFTRKILPTMKEVVRK